MRVPVPPGRGWDTRRSMPHRKAASVLPDPVGARMSVWSPAAIAGHPSDWAAVGAGKLVENQAWTAGEHGAISTDQRYRGGVTVSPWGRRPVVRHPEREERDPTGPVPTGQPGGRGGRADRHPAPSWPVHLRYPRFTPDKHREG